MTDEEKKAIEHILEDIKDADVYDLAIEDATICFVEDLKYILKVIEKKDNIIKAMAKELTNLLEAAEEEIIDKFTRR